MFTARVLPMRRFLLQEALHQESVLVSMKQGDRVLISANTDATGLPIITSWNFSLFSRR
jgi:hypothetical protein